MNTRPTPETDAQCYDCEYQGDMGGKFTASAGKLRPDGDHVPADFARKLERERGEAREEIAAMRDAIREAHEALEGCQEDTCELIAERDWWKNEPRCGYSARWAEMNVRFAKAVAALAKLKPFLP